SRPDWTFPHDQTASDPNPLPALRLQVAVPKYPWTDLAYSLAPNGHPGLSQCAPDDDTCAIGSGNPTGVVKYSYVNGFFALGNSGHSRAQNPPATWHRLNNQAWQFLQANIGGTDHPQQTTVTSEQTVCDGSSAGAPQELTASTPEGLAAGTLSVAFDRGGSL